MPTGVVKFYNADRGFGFITRDDGMKEMFVHISNCAEHIEELSEGQRVQFEEGISPKNGKLEAKRVVLL